MDIAFDVSSYIKSIKTGISYYSSELIKSLLKIDKSNYYKLFAFLWNDYGNAFDSLQNPTSNSRIIQKRFPQFFLRFLWSRMKIPLEFFVGKYDVYHATEHIIPYTEKGKLVCTVHDIISYFHPEWFPEFMNKKTKHYLNALRRCNLLIAISENTKKDLIRFSDLPSEKIEVIYPGCSSEFYYKSKMDVINQIKEKYGLDKDYILFIGTIEPRKNLSLLIDAYIKLRRRRRIPQFVIIGMLGWKYDDVLKKIKEHSDYITYLGYLPHFDKVNLLKGAFLFVYPSLYEGFGLPVLEAMASETPVVTSNVTSIPEITGISAILIDPTNITSIEDGLERGIFNDSLRKQIIRVAKKRAEQFTWEKTAQQTLRCYEKSLSF